MKTGVWLIREYLQGGVIDRQMACSVCGYESGHVKLSWNYCPVCGARIFMTLSDMKAYVKENEVKCGNIT